MRRHLIHEMPPPSRPKVDHPHCMKLYCVFDEPTKTSLVLELILGGNMQHRMGINGCPFSESTASLILSDVLSALRCLHRPCPRSHMNSCACLA